MIIILDAMRRPAEAEREELKKQLAEALETSAIRSRIVNKQTLELAEARAEIERKDKNLQVIAALANNVLYFDDNSDYESALWNILAAAKPELFAESDMPKLKFMPGSAAERGE